MWNGAGPLGHIGIATGSGHMISALNHTSGTVHTPIAGYGPAGAPLTFHRLNGVAEIPGASGSGSLGSLAGAALAGLAIGAAIPAVLFGLAALIGVAGAAVIALALGRAAGGS